MINNEIKGNLNGLLADFTVMYMKLHHYHWFVKGPHFFTLHEKFEELYNEVTGHVDDIAERLLTVGETPISTLKECLETATTKEATTVGTEKEMVEELLADFRTIMDKLNAGLALTENEPGTNDLLLGILTSLEKHSWMLRAYIG
ncbi:Dps family protein [Bacillus kwashiorkori]|uniref:Dps family protein n=1 Tax=Bacillus kwashiorkori TaxID=1522318 RepID=UPI000AA2A42A|nr:Dps family protein [Bacillus kwashiorkori]